MAAGPSARVPVAFEEVAVYFSPAEWAELAEWQQELYWEVMKENYALVASLGSDDIRLGSWIGATRQAKPGIRAGRIVGAAAGPRVPLHQDKAGERQSCVRPAQVAFEDVAVRFSPAEWAELAEWQRELYWAVMRETYELLASLGSADAQPESAWHTERLAQQPWQQRGVYEAPSLGARSRAGDTQRSPGAPKPLSGAAAAPAPHTCKDCGQSFAERDMLVVHVLRTHLGDRRLPCKECGKSLSGPGRLAAHQRAHLRERTFTCVACKRSVVYKPPLVDSVRLELAGGKPFKCTSVASRPQEHTSAAHLVARSSQERKRAPAWSHQEILDLIAVWGEEPIFLQLQARKRNADIYAAISQGMSRRGHARDTQQCRVKIKELRQNYQKCKQANGQAGAPPQRCRYYDELHTLLGTEATASLRSHHGSALKRASREGDEAHPDVEEADNSGVQASAEAEPVSREPSLNLELVPLSQEAALKANRDAGEGPSGSDLARRGSGPSPTCTRLPQMQRRKKSRHEIWESYVDITKENGKLSDRRKNMVDRQAQMNSSLLSIMNRQLELFEALIEKFK
ncbi:uncharacterized protein LOC142008206 isoform X2 [Carettochelys insculpta]|uniref:uncharacterized protein LOC142008206 isoform X2 n=1 Tax=Carettochelys insculpta TaxID=44489 RepID=UPI003EBF92E4